MRRRPAMTDEDKKLLTEYLGERWRDKTVEDVFEWEENRTFYILDDMMDLYDRLFQKHKWHKFTVFAKTRFSFNDYNQTFTNIETGFYAWVFCLDGDGYEDRCQMVAEWIKEGK
jgi:hypothetical protein